jgi:hypothetical protein
MGQAKRRGTFAQRRSEAIAAGRVKGLIEDPATAALKLARPLPPEPRRRYDRYMLAAILGAAAAMDKPR